MGRVESFTASVLLTCFVVLALAQVNARLRWFSLKPDSVLPAPHYALTRRTALEVGSGTLDRLPAHETASTVAEKPAFA